VKYALYDLNSSTFELPTIIFIAQFTTNHSLHHKLHGS
jgi:hypothetical protein